MILHTYRDVQEAVPYNPSYGVNCNCGEVTVHTQVWIRSAIVRIWLNFYVCCRVRRPRGAAPMILHTYRDVQEAVPYNPC